MPGHQLFSSRKLKAQCVQVTERRWLQGSLILPDLNTHVFILWIFYTAVACGTHSTSVPWFECCISYAVCNSLNKQNIRKIFLKGKKKRSPKRKMSKMDILVPSISGNRQVVKNVPAGQSSAPITLLPTTDSFNLKHWGLCTMELHFFNLLSLTLIQHVNHYNSQVRSKRCRLLCPSKHAELD